MALYQCYFSCYNFRSILYNWRYNLWSFGTHSRCCGNSLVVFNSSDCFNSIGDTWNIGFNNFFNFIGFCFGVSNSRYDNKIRFRIFCWEHILFWISTAFLWVAWITQNNANMFVFLPRCLTLTELIIATSIMVLS